ncbi:prolipoprotein diacylglyceryl transferase [Companilactobacillus sp. RD055328]|uniref:prolipoprotein diacylglyceryl transferase n=1 Tax=Companilactobacillus sp. RD055328 TaxID=2916634 RepID=UPI001FC8AA57|nr:prolipoprotein diacylglyceryl transferase [Companilactobacillus sp. RD055328]GKQ43046.1 prolipoprotein diacylglyceryl transferase [Companilactobacillus sp. RD055328]
MQELLTLNPIAFSFGGLQIHWYGLIIATGAFLGVMWAMNEAQKQNIDSEKIIDMVLWIAPFALIGARLYYVLFELPFYLSHPEEIIKIWHGGIAIYGGLLAALAVVIIFCRRNQISPWKMLDIAAPSVMLGQIIGRWGNFMNQEAFGAVTSHHFLISLHLPDFVINQMLISGQYRQPTFLYESVWNLIGLVIILIIRQRGLFKQGDIILSYVTWYAFGRFFIEGMRTDSLYIFGVFRVSQLLSVVLFFGAIGIMIYRHRTQKLPLYNLK